MRNEWELQREGAREGGGASLGPATLASRLLLSRRDEKQV